MGSQADEEWGLLGFCIHSRVHENVFSLSPYSQLGEEKGNRADSGPVQVEAIFKWYQMVIAIGKEIKIVHALESLYFGQL